MKKFIAFSAIATIFVLAAGLLAKPLHLLVTGSSRLAAAPPRLATEEWTGSDKPYKEIAARIKSEYDQGKNPDSLAEEYRINAQKHPSDPVAQFGWVCAARGAAVISNTLPSKAFQLLKILEKADPGNVHEYTRYRFCMSGEADLAPSIRDIKTVGDRLLGYDPKDKWVRLSMINLFCSYTEGAREALPYAEKWVRLEPDNNKAHSALGLVYFDLWEAGGRKNRTIADNAITEYKTFLRLAPANDGFRQPAQQYIKNLQKYR